MAAVQEVYIPANEYWSRYFGFRGWGVGVLLLCQSVVKRYRYWVEAVELVASSLYNPYLRCHFLNTSAHFLMGCAVTTFHSILFLLLFHLLSSAFLNPILTLNALELLCCDLH